MSSRTKEAFLFSAEKLVAETGQLFLWTFTFREVPLSDDWALDQWIKACKNGKRDFQGVHGLRVIELHKLHGMHFHLLLNSRFPVERMLRIFWPLGFGMINVEKCDLGASAYMAKYLTKKGRNGDFLGRRRRWGAFGGFRPTRCKDISYESNFQRNKILVMFLRFASQGFRARAFNALIGASLFGSWPDWPETVKVRFLGVVAACGVRFHWESEYGGAERFESMADRLRRGYDGLYAVSGLRNYSDDEMAEFRADLDLHAHFFAETADPF